MAEEVLDLPREGQFSIGMPPTGCTAVRMARVGCDFELVADCPSERSTLEALGCENYGCAGMPRAELTAKFKWQPGWFGATGVFAVNVTGHSGSAGNCSGLYAMVLNRL